MAKKPDGTKGKKPDAKTAKKVNVKVKGPVPTSYAPKQRTNNDYHDYANKRLRDEEYRNRFIVEGVEGSYFVGVRGEIPKAESFVVRMNQGRNVDFLIIEAADEIFVPHVWLFIPMDKCHFALGRIGDKQRLMLELLKSALDLEIKRSKDARRMQQHGAHISVPQLGIRKAAQLSHYADDDNVSQKPPAAPARRIDEFDRTKSILLTKQVLKAKLMYDGVVGLCHVGDYNDLKIYFLHERIAGAQKITFLEGGADEVLTAIEDLYPRGVSVDVKSVIDGLQSSVTSVDLEDVHNARQHVTTWLCHHFDYAKQVESLQPISVSA